MITVGVLHYFNRETYSLLDGSVFGNHSAITCKTKVIRGKITPVHPLHRAMALAGPPQSYWPPKRELLEQLGSPRSTQVLRVLSRFLTVQHVYSLSLTYHSHTMGNRNYASPVSDQPYA